MKIQAVILRAVGKRITWWQAAEIIGVTDRTMRRWKGRYEEHGYDGLYDRKLGKPGMPWIGRPPQMPGARPSATSASSASTSPDTWVTTVKKLILRFCRCCWFCRSRLRHCG